QGSLCPRLEIGCIHGLRLGVTRQGDPERERIERGQKRQRQDGRSDDPAHHGQRHRRPKHVARERDQGQHGCSGSQRDRPKGAGPADSMSARNESCPAAMSCWIWSTRITLLRMMMPASAMTPRIATKPNGAWNIKSAAAAPMIPSGAVANTVRVLPKCWSWTI